MLINLSSAMPDIIIDAAAAGLSRDNQERASDIQSLLNGALAMGGVIANGTSGWLVQWLHPQHVFLLCAIPPFLLVVSSMLRVLPEKRLPPCERKLDITFMKRHKEVTILSACLTLMSVTLAILQMSVESAWVRGIFILVCGTALSVSIYFSLRSVHPLLAKVALFCFMRESMQPNLTDPMFVWMTSDPQGPMFSPMLMGSLGICSSAGLLLGIVVYNKFLTGVSYRRIFFVAQLALVAYNMSDLILVNRWNLELGIPDVVFVAGDDAFGKLVGRIFFIPLFVLCSKVCPRNLEATMFAMLMALGNFGYSIGQFFGSAVCDVYGIKDGSFDLLPEAVITKSFCRLVPIPLIFLLVPGITPNDPIPGMDDACGGVPSDSSNANLGVPPDSSNANLEFEDDEAPAQGAAAATCGTPSRARPEICSIPTAGQP